MKRKVEIGKIIIFSVIALLIMTVIVFFIYQTESKKNTDIIEIGNKRIDELNTEVSNLKNQLVLNDELEYTEITNFTEEFLKSLYNVNPENYSTYVTKVKSMTTETAFNQLNLHDDSEGEGNYEGITFESSVSDIVCYIKKISDTKFDVFMHATYKETAVNHKEALKMICNVTIQKNVNDMIITEIMTNQTIIGNPF